VASKDPKVRQAYRKNNIEQHRQSNRDYFARVRAATLKVLGGKCGGLDCYGWGQDSQVLQIDHVAGDGAHDRELRGVSNGPALLRAVRKNPDRFQLLCANCHVRKTLANKEHHRKIRGLEAVFE
jgi:hypothetical protein